MRLLNPGYESESVNNSLYWSRESGTCYAGYSNKTTICNFSSTGLTSEAKNMIEDAVWYTSAADYELTASESYAEERASTTPDFSSEDEVTRTTNWIGKVALMYPSDYGYASSGCRNGGKTLYDYGDIVCTSTNWLHNYDNSGFQATWLLGPSSIGERLVRAFDDFGSVSYTHYAYYTYDLRTTTFLTSSVKIIGGTGTIDNMYQLSL